jgi:hypothetical protein
VNAYTEQEPEVVVIPPGQHISLTEILRHIEAGRTVFITLPGQPG